MNHSPHPSFRTEYPASGRWSGPRPRSLPLSGPETGGKRAVRPLQSREGTAASPAVPASCLLWVAGNIRENSSRDEREPHERSDETWHLIPARFKESENKL